MEHDVFISHKIEDKDVAVAVCKQFEGRGIRCWLFQRDQKSGMEYAPQIERAIAKSRVTVFIFSEYSNESPKFVARELESAVEKGSDVIVLRIDEVDPSISFSFFIKTTQWLNAFPEVLPKHLKRLTKIVQRRLYEGDFNSAKDLWSKKQWLSCLKQCATIYEKGMRELLKDLLEELKDKNVRKRIMATQRKIGGGKSTFTGFGLPKLVQLYLKAGVLDQLRIQLTSSLPNIHRVDWSQVVECYRASKRQDCAQSVAKPAAEKMVEFLKILLYDCELAGDPEEVETVEDLFLPECGSCTRPLEEGWNFCPHCGISAKMTCEQCHRPLQPDWNICPYCATKRALQPCSGRLYDLQKARDEYRIMCGYFYTDHVVSVPEKIRLEEKRLELGLSAEEAQKIERACAPRNTWKYMQVVRRVLVDGVIDEGERLILDTKAKEWNIEPWAKKQIEEAETAIRHGALDKLGPDHREDATQQRDNGRQVVAKKKVVNKQKDVTKKTARRKAKRRTKKKATKRKTEKKTEKKGKRIVRGRRAR